MLAVSAHSGLGDLAVPSLADRTVTAWHPETAVSHLPMADRTVDCALTLSMAAATRRPLVRSSALVERVVTARTWTDLA